MNHRIATKSGFTLIELLVVIAIIAVLAGILFPVFARAKENGFKTAALGQMKQLGTAFTLYLDDHDGKLLPSTNYGDSDGDSEKIWTNQLNKYAKSGAVFVAPGSDGVFADTWDKRGGQTVGYNSSTAIDQQRGCSDDQSDTKGCIAFTKAAEFSKSSNPSAMALFAVTPGGAVADKYLGYEFSPYNGVPNPNNPNLSAPLTSDRDLVKELGPTLPAELIKPLFARYLASGSDDGQTPVVFGDSHAKSYSAKQINADDSQILWRIR